jgi:hypothetical protein
MAKTKAESFHSAEKRESPQRFKFQTLAAEIERDLRAFYEPGQRFESEPSLCRRFGLNRETVRRAILQLEQQGLLRRKGRAGTFVADFRQIGYDGRLIGVAMAIRNHLWDTFFLALSNQSIAHSRYPLICDFSGTGTSDPFGSRLPAARMAERLRAVLRLRPRTLVTDLASHEDEALTSLGDMRSFFNNLILINQPRLHGFARCASVRVDGMAGHALQARSARAAGYERLILLLPHGSAPIPEMQSQFATPAGGAFPFSKQTILYEHDPDRDAHLIEQVRRYDAPMALIANYDYGAHLAKEALQTAGLWDPRRVGLYGMNNTPWAVQDDLTSVSFDPDVWARMVFEAEAELEAKGAAADRRVSPTLIERGSTMHLRPVRPIRNHAILH